MVTLMDLSFHLDFGTVLVSAGVLIIPASAKWLWHKFEQKLNENRVEAKDHAEAVAVKLAQEAQTIKDELATYQDTTQHTLKRIEDQTTLTNGRVNALEKNAEFVRGVLIGKGEQV